MRYSIILFAFAAVALAQSGIGNTTHPMLPTGLAGNSSSATNGTVSSASLKATSKTTTSHSSSSTSSTSTSTSGSTTTTSGSPTSTKKSSAADMAQPVLGLGFAGAIFAAFL